MKLYIYPKLTPDAYFGKWSMYFPKSYQLPLEKDEPLYLYKLESPLPKDALYWVLIGPVALEKKIFKILSMLFNYFDYIYYKANK